MDFSDHAENKIADFMRGQGLTLPSFWYAALGSAGSDSAFTELAGSGYARVSIQRLLTKWQATQGGNLASTGTSHASSNTDPITFGAPGSAWGTASKLALFDASSGGNRWMTFSIPSIVITTGSPASVEVAAGALQFTLGLQSGSLLGCSDYLANKLIDLLFRAQAFSWPATTYLAAYTAAPTAAGGGTEVSGGSYARAAIASTLTAWSGTQLAGSTSASSGTSGRISNNAPVAYPAPTADWGTIVSETLKDSPTGGNQLFHGDVTPKSVLNGGPALTHAADKVGITIA